MNNLCGININFRYMGLWDTVSSQGINILDDEADVRKRGWGTSLTVSDKWRRITHAISVNNHRSGFAVRSIFNDSTHAQKKSNSAKMIEKGFLGAHADIGGGYKEGDLSNISLSWTIKNAQNLGIRFSNVERYKSSLNPVMHDNVGIVKLKQYYPSREFLRATQSAQGSPHFVSQPHLRLNWADTLQFLPNNGQKLHKIKEYSQEYQNYKPPICSKREGTCSLTPIEKYLLLKSKDGNKDKTILYNDIGQENITNYMNWLRKNGYDLL